MIDFDLPKQQSSIIKVIGVGGGGGNSVNHMFSQKIENVDFISCNTDAQALNGSLVPNRIQLGPHLTQGLGAGANPEVGKQATEESLDEIKRILEVNTKMAFICAGMGGGTGTGGAPIVAKICQDLGILTVGIVTTPFLSEGVLRKIQAEEGIKALAPHVDTLIVISNDKLQQQFKKLKLREAFAKADDVVATAAKCITDIINSHGQINVDFADVCTVMRKGGVAILGSAVAEGDNRAQTAIENAINSPLLNDNDIKGAKWILLNITTGEGDYECGMDEFELINNYIRQQTGENTDIIVGTGINNSLDRALAVTLIATGFAQKNPFPVKIDIVNLDPEPEREDFILKDISEPKSEEESEPATDDTDSKTGKTESLFEDEVISPQLTLFELDTKTPAQEKPAVKTPNKTDKGKELFSLLEEKAEDNPVATPLTETIFMPEEKIENENFRQDTGIIPAAIKPSKIYVSKPNGEQINSIAIQAVPAEEKEEAVLKMVVKEEKTKPPVTHVIDDADYNEEEIKRKKAEERVQKLRNLPLNFSGRKDENDDLENVPAYVRRSLEMLDSNMPKENVAENYYSKYTVNKDERNQTIISGINAFLEGEKPD